MAMAMRVVNITNNDFNFPVSSSSGEAMSPLSSSPPSASPLGQWQKQTSGKKFVGIAPKVVETKSNTSLANLWRQVQGSNNWDNLVEPLNPLLRQEIIRYGEFAGACYKAFDLDPNSKRYFNCKYGKERLLQEVGIQDSGYEITKYIYATPDVSIPTQNICGRWIGYVGVSTDEESKRLGRRDLMVAFRGTVTYPEWLANVMTSLTSPRFDPNNYRLDVKVEEGFLTLYTTKDEENKFSSGSCREQLLSEVQRLLNKYKGEEVSITLSGHSMGSSLALLLAYDIAELELNRHESDEDEIPITVFSFAGPRVGNLGFKKRCEELGIKVLRIVNVNDPVTKMPGVFLNENFGFLGGKFKFPWSCSCYVHAGVEIALDFFTIENPICVHDLETYIEFLRCPYRSKEKSEKKRVGFIGGFISNAQNMYSLDRIGMAMVNIVFSTFICYWWMSVSIDVDQVIHFLR